MAELRISNFSCIRDAVLELRKVNVIIGPQGAGKSVTTKLLYFFTDVPQQSLLSAERGDTVEEFKHHLTSQFLTWFPPTAWGRSRFRISYEAGPFSVRMLRRQSNSKLLDQVAVTFPEWFTSLYESARMAFRNAKQVAAASEDEGYVDSDFQRSMLVRRKIISQITSKMGSEYCAQQTFIPAGRAFFTSIGRLVAGFEQAGSLDPVTIKFARRFAAIRDRPLRLIRAPTDKSDRDYAEQRRKTMADLFGGEIRFERDAAYVLAKDGRKIPFTYLSSGQQELLPMWSVIDYATELDRRHQEGPNNHRQHAYALTYIEEPEAHLFPSAQSLLMEYLISSQTYHRPELRLILTTHSPYIMGKLNVFLKAGQLAKRKKKNNDVAAIVPRNCWLSRDDVVAFALEDGQLRNIVDEEGLIDSAYLDGVSEDISREFSKLLKVESEIQ